MGGEDAVCLANELFDTWKIRPPSLRSFSQMPCSIQWRRRMPVVRAKFDPSSLSSGVYIGHNYKERDISPADLPHQRWSMVGKRLIFLRSTGASFSGSVHRSFCVRGLAVGATSPHGRRPPNNPLCESRALSSPALLFIVFFFSALLRGLLIGRRLWVSVQHPRYRLSRPRRRGPLHRKLEELRH